MANDRLRTSITIHCSRRDIETEINYYSSPDDEAYFSLQLGAAGRLSDVDIYMSKEQMVELMNAISAALQDADVEANEDGHDDGTPVRIGSVLWDNGRQYAVIGLDRRDEGLVLVRSAETGREFEKTASRLCYEDGSPVDWVGASSRDAS